jgi:hypothetical protein
MAILYSCSRIPLLQLIHCLKSVRPQFWLFIARWTLVTDKHFPCPDILLPVGVLSYSVLSCRDVHCWMLHEQQQTISMRSNVREWTHVLLVNTQCSHLHSFCATGMSSGLATMVTLTSVMGEVWRVYYTGVDLLLISFLCRSAWLLLGCVLNSTSCSTCNRQRFLLLYTKHGKGWHTYERHLVVFVRRQRSSLINCAGWGWWRSRSCMLISRRSICMRKSAPASASLQGMPLAAPPYVSDDAM